MSVLQQQRRITQLLQDSNQASWQDWWDTKLIRNQELIKAIQANDISVVADLLNEVKYQDQCADVNFQHKQDLQPLHYAVKGKNEEMVKLLIEKFPDVNARTQQGETPLHIACKIGSFEIVQILT